MISTFRRALRRIQKRISSLDLEEICAVFEFRQLVELFEEPGLSIILKILKEEANLIGIGGDILSHILIQLPVSAYASGYPSPQLSKSPLSRDGR